MASEIPPHFRAALNPRELPAHRVERLWALHAELTSAPGLANAAAWLPAAWPHLLQLLNDAHPDVRAAAAPLVGHLGAVLAGGGGVSGLAPSTHGAHGIHTTAPTHHATATTVLVPVVQVLTPVALAPAPGPGLAYGAARPGVPPPHLTHMAHPTHIAHQTHIAVPIPLAAGGGPGPGPLPPFPPHARPRHAHPAPGHSHGHPQQHHHHPAPAPAASAPGAPGAVPLNPLSGRMPPTALLDWALAVLPADSKVAAAQHLRPEAKASALGALCACVAAMPAPALAPYGGQLLRLCCGLLEAASTPPALLGPLLRLLLAALPGVPLAALGHALSDLADLLCGWALEPAMASADRHLVTLVLHALRPQWHSHPAFAAELTCSMANDLTAAAAALAEAVGAASTAAIAADADAQAAAVAAAQQQVASCVPLLQLLVDIFSAISLRPPPPPDAADTATAAAAAAAPLLLTRPGAATAQNLLELYPQLLAATKGIAASLAQLGPLAAGGVDEGGSGAMTEEAMAAAAAAVCRCVAVLAEAAASCTPDEMDARDVAEVCEALQSGGTGGGGGSDGASASDIAGLLAAMTLDEEAGCESVVGSKQPSAAGPVSAALRAVTGKANGAAVSGSGGDSRDENEAAGRVEPAGPSSERGTEDSRRRCAALRAWVLRLGLDWSMGALAAAAEGSGAGALAAGGPAGGAELAALTELTVQLLRLVAAELADWPRLAAGLVVEAVLEETVGGNGEGCGGLRRLRASQRLALVSAAAKVLHGALLTARVDNGSSRDGSGNEGAAKAACSVAGSVANAALSWVLEDLSAQLASQSVEPPSLATKALPWPASQAHLMPRAASKAALAGGELYAADEAVAAGAATSGSCSKTAGEDISAAAAFDCAVLQAACQRGLLPTLAAAKVEAVTWTLLTASGAAVDAGAAPPPSVLCALFDAWAAAGLCTIVGLASQRPQPQQLQLASGDPEAADSLTASTTRALRSCCAAYLSTLHSLLVLLPRRAGSAAASSGASAAGATVTASLGVLLGASACSGSDGSGGNHALLAALQLRAVAALRRLVAHPAMAAGSATAPLRSARLFALAAESVAAGMASSDASVRAAAADCGAALAAGPHRGAPPCAAAAGPPAVQPAPAAALPAAVLPAEAYAPLLAAALDGLTDTSAPAAEAAARLAAELAEAALVAATAAGVPASIGSWLPDWQDELALAPQQWSLRLPQLVRLMEAVFGQAPVAVAVPTGAAGPGGAAGGGSALLLRKRVPGAQGGSGEGAGGEREDEEGGGSAGGGGGGGGAGGGAGGTGAGGVGAGGGNVGGGKMEVLHRLALALQPLVVASSPSPASSATSTGDGDAKPTAEAAEGQAAAGAVLKPQDVFAGRCSALLVGGRSAAALAWLAVQEGAKQLVAGRLRTHLGGPTQTLGALERMLQATYSRMSQERREARGVAPSLPLRSSSSRDGAWLLLELVGGLERAVAAAAEGVTVGGSGTGRKGGPGVGAGGVKAEAQLQAQQALPQPVLAFFAANRKKYTKYASCLPP
ncbi:hypothetical protein HYH02_011539 [Chlamydomonas schloesseri]|uniref:Uncharacterized protein n=1 Tax=Chlamydomonas schloesseri TaxID=2026947 RepID=A0A835W107_9CHLO|nr:hypothetical protein HYH02_011539 [Chlamydomonas schloesseri]|eukprot:KAG2436602.1 hypothetical protein HYH02_011539 [Chlamydomonas schloesseri]